MLELGPDDNFPWLPPRDRAAAAAVATTDKRTGGTGSTLGDSLDADGGRRLRGMSIRGGGVGGFRGGGFTRGAGTFSSPHRGPSALYGRPSVRGAFPAGGTAGRTPVQGVPVVQGHAVRPTAGLHGGASGRTGTGWHGAGHVGGGYARGGYAGGGSPYRGGMHGGGLYGGGMYMRSPMTDMYTGLALMHVLRTPRHHERARLGGTGGAAGTSGAGRLGSTGAGAGGAALGQTYAYAAAAVRAGTRLVIVRAAPLDSSRLVPDLGSAAAGSIGRARRRRENITLATACRRAPFECVWLGEWTHWLGEVDSLARRSGDCLAAGASCRQAADRYELMEPRLLPLTRVSRRDLTRDLDLGHALTALTLTVHSLSVYPNASTSGVGSSSAPAVLLGLVSRAAGGGGGGGGDDLTFAAAVRLTLLRLGWWATLGATAGTFYHDGGHFLVGLAAVSMLGMRHAAPGSAPLHQVSVVARGEAVPRHTSVQTGGGAAVGAAAEGSMSTGGGGGGGGSRGGSASSGGRAGGPFISADGEILSVGSRVQTMYSVEVGGDGEWCDGGHLLTERLGEVDLRRRALSHTGTLAPSWRCSPSNGRSCSTTAGTFTGCGSARST